MIGILCEKPSAARNFAAALGGNSGKYNGEDYKIVAARGHLYEFVQPDEMVDSSLQTKYKSWATGNLPWNFDDFNWKRTKKKDTSQLLTSLKNELSTCAEIVIATDVDPTGEGELLAYEILEELKLSNKRISRMYFIDESVPEIQKAFVSRKIIPDFYGNSDYKKALHRAKFDFLTMQFTRIATTCGNGNSVIRQGRLKSAMISIVGDGIAAVTGYKKIPFYCNKFKDENGNVYTNPNEPLFPDKKQVPNKYNNSPVILEGVERKSTPPKKLLDLASLSSILAPKGYKAKAVLDTYQKLYEAKIVSYPRTEDKVISPEQFNDLLPLVDKIAAVVGVDKALLTHRIPRNTHVKAGGSHGANRPGPVVPTDLQSLASYGACAPAIYELLAKSYLAMLAEDYIYDSERGFIRDYPDFKGKSAIPISSGWKAVFNDDDKDDNDDTSSNHLGKNAIPFIHEGFPPKPATPTMKWLMKQLEKCDVGTGATRTSTYADVTNEKSKYPLLVDKKGKLSMAECGEISYKLLPNTHIGSVSLTEELQQDMRDIAAGKITSDACLAKVAGYVTDDLKTMTNNGQNIQKVGNSMSETKEKYEGMWNGKPVSFNRDFSGHRFTDEECEALCNGDEIEVHGLVSAKTGNTYAVKGKLNNLTYNGNKYVGFERLGFCDTKGVPRAWCGHAFTDEEKKSLESGCEIYIEGLKSSSTGKIFNAHLKFDSKTNKISPRF